MATIQAPAIPDAGISGTGLDPADLEILEEIERRVLWLSTHDRPPRQQRAAHPRKRRKVGGHQASSASVATILTALYFHFLRAGDRVSIKPHASPVFHAAQYLLGRLDRNYLPTLREFGGLQAYPSAAPRTPIRSISRPARSAWARWRPSLPRLAHRYASSTSATSPRTASSP